MLTAISASAAPQRAAQAAHAVDADHDGDSR